MIVVHSDACKRPGTDGIGLGWVIKQWKPGETPEVVSTGNEFIEGKFTSVEAEFMALIRASRAALRYTKEFVLFYSDCLPVVDKIDMEQPLADDGRFLRTWDIYMSKFPDSKLLWISREHNGVADGEAHAAIDRKA